MLTCALGIMAEEHGSAIPSRKELRMREKFFHPLPATALESRKKESRMSNCTGCAMPQDAHLAEQLSPLPGRAQLPARIQSCQGHPRLVRSLPRDWRASAADPVASLCGPAAGEQCCSVTCAGEKMRKKQQQID